ncbi:chromosome partitioning protein [Halorhodospira abdelmalekii]|uniref:ParA family protein n=1 Tax=Halorhodospira abdelmalekii TaxID=421629 RepID=UPI0019070CBF|nr:ParA family protein [Halorhodospira abdelmalekii]MBK1734436.1 chromosome partitioning protein [Halorhodospira abdelmalekii]
MTATDANSTDATADATSSPTRCPVIVVSNRKGGTGKTTTAVNLAAECAAAGSTTLLIDLDTQSHCALGLGVAVTTERPAVHRLFDTPGTLLSATIHPTAYEGLEIAPGSTDFQHGATPDDDQILARALADPALIGRYDVVIIDSPPSLDRLLLNALSAATLALIPFVPHPLAGEGVKQLARVFFRVAMSSNANLRLLGLVPIMVDPRIGQHRRVCEQVAQQFGAERLLGSIRSDIKLAEAFAAGEPIRTYAPRSRGNQDYHALSETVRQRLAKS